jgi:(p)ppGpp synthase/HD superfamily hydrolase
MKKGEMLSKMLVLATNKHNGQFDKGGNPYILHPLRVMYQLKTDDEELNCIALGHDLVEDTDVTYKQLAELGFTSRIISGIKAMTKLPGEDYDDAMARITSNPDSIKVKMQDLRHNSDIRRLKGITDKDVARVTKYHKMYMTLKVLNE